MNTLDCTDIKALLSAYVDDQLDAETRHEADRHLGACASCRAMIDGAERLDSLLAMDAASRAQRPLADDFIGGVLARTVYAAPMRLSVWRRMAMGAGWGLAAASLMLAALIWMMPRPTSPPAPQRFAMDTATVEPAAPQTMPRTVVRPVAYTTGEALRSQTFDVTMSAEAFRPDPSPTPAPTLEHMAIDRAEVRPRIAEPADRHAVSHDDADTFYAASLVLELLAGADVASFVDVERARRIVEADELLPRLRDARERLEPHDRPSVIAAEGILVRVAEGPIDHDDARLLRDTVTGLQLSREMGRLSRWDGV
jgi:hypothetical protein